MTTALALEAKPLIVVGAGYAGILCANRLARRRREPVLLVTEHDSFLHRVRLHETAARGRVNTLPLRRLLHPRVQSLHARAVGLDAQARQLQVRDRAGARTLDYHKLVLALGSNVVAPFATSAPHALALASHERALAFSRALRSAPEGAWINVIGGGLTAVELASELAEAHPRLRVRMLCEQLAAQLPAGPHAALTSGLDKLRVELVEQVSVTALDETGAHDGGARCWPALHSVLATGFRPNLPEWLRTLPTSGDGRIAVDQALRVLGFTDLFAVGDLAAPPASCIGNGVRTTRMGCVNAMPLAAHAADVIARDDAYAFHFNYPGQNVSLGRRNAIVLFTDADDRPTGRYLDGRSAALIKELVCRFVVTALRLEARGWLGYAWLGMRTRTPATALPHSS
jgi:NADH:ubiquinone reductase (H+-translocating)